MGFLEQLFSRPDGEESADAASKPAPEPRLENSENPSAPVNSAPAAGPDLKSAESSGPAVHFRKYAGAPFIATLRPVTLTATVAPEQPSPAHAPASDSTAVRPVAAQPPHVRPVVVRPAIQADAEGPENDSMESLFATMERPDIAEIAARVAEWPGLRGCLIWTEASLAQAGRFPKGFNAGFVRERVALISESAIEVDASTGGSAVKGMTIHGAEHDFAIFRNGTAVICVLADDRDLPPGIRARLAQVARALTAIGR